MQDALWFVGKNVEKDLRASANAKKIEYWTYTEAIRGKNRTVTLGSFEIQKERNIKRQKQGKIEM